MRSDSILNTGVTGASINKAQRAKEARDLRSKEKLEKRAQLLPAAEIVVNELNKELEATKYALLSIINPSTPEENVKALISALNLYDQSMKNLKSRLSNIMRVQDEN